MSILQFPQVTDHVTDHFPLPDYLYQNFLMLLVRDLSSFYIPHVNASDRTVFFQFTETVPKRNISEAKYIIYMSNSHETVSPL